MLDISTEEQLAGLCIALIGSKKALSRAEQALARHAEMPNRALLSAVRAEAKSGGDPLGDIFARIRPQAIRRASGAVYTPATIAKSMLRWIGSQCKPTRIVDAGAGSGRFTVAAATMFPLAKIVAIESDPLAALMLRANLALHRVLKRVRVLVCDFRVVKLPRIRGVTAFIGNPPYVRHHQIEDRWKNWYGAVFSKLGISASNLAGLHAHFFLKTRLLAQPGDVGAYITSAEWLDVNYGSALRHLLTEELGGIALHVLEPAVEAFPGTATTAAITCFRVGETTGPIKVRAVAKLSALNGLSKGSAVSRAVFRQEDRWSGIIRPEIPSDDARIELGELFRVHRGQVTGANDVWIAGARPELPESVLFAAITKARDLIQAGEMLESDISLRRVIDIPADLDILRADERRAIEKFLKWARQMGAHEGYIAQHRKAWWSVGLKPPAAILCTYMARRPPQFTLNAVGARHINIAHGLYPREPIPQGILESLISWLNKNVSARHGRTYSGGLTKFEPKEIERLRIPRPESFALA